MSYKPLAESRSPGEEIVSRWLVVFLRGKGAAVLACDGLSGILCRLELLASQPERHHAASLAVT